MGSIRFVLIQGFLGGIAGVCLFFGILLQWMSGPNQLNVPMLAIGASITYYVAIGILGVLIVIAIYNSFTDKVFVHPDDKLFGNIFTFILFMALTLCFGYFQDESLQKTSYDSGVILLLLFIFVYVMLFFAKKIGFHELLMDDQFKREKELMARFILFTVLLGALLVFLRMLFDVIYAYLSYNWGVLFVGLATFVVLMIVGLSTWRKYEPIGPKKDLAPKE
ncbi:MAG: hypothetical protein ACFFCS_02070 [Candidatus Hodarchaeota archaeon]